MFSKKNLFKLLTMFLVSLGLFSTLNGAYFKSDFFPIGLTGLGFTGYDVPYNKTWAYERGLINTLEVNCIGCEDAWQKALIDFAGNGSREHTYLEKVCIPLAAQRDSNNNYDTVYLITASYGAAAKRFDKNIIFKYTEANL
jgi:hypothetical protein